MKGVADGTVTPFYLLKIKLVKSYPIKGRRPNDYSFGLCYEKDFSDLLLKPIIFRFMYLV